MNNTKIKRQIAREKKVLTQEELAKKLGITQAYLSMILSGKRKNTKVLNDLNQIIRKAS